MADRVTPTLRVSVSVYVAAAAAVVAVAAAVLCVVAVVMIRQPRPPAPADACACDDEADAPVEPVPTAPPDAAPVDPGQSIGAPRLGALLDGTLLGPGRGYFVRNPMRAYATRETVAHLRAALGPLRSRFRGLHRLVVGDLSRQGGGVLQGHRSHQSGRDVDLGFFYRELPEGFPAKFVRGTRDNLHVRATFELVKSLSATADTPTGIEWILLDYEIQGLLYRWGARQGMSEEELARLFQYPRGSDARQGLVRHYRNHRDHMHVRFKCPLDSPSCEPTFDGPPPPLPDAQRTASVGAL